MTKARLVSSRKPLARFLVFLFSVAVHSWGGMDMSQVVSGLDFHKHYFDLPSDPNAKPIPTRMLSSIRDGGDASTLSFVLDRYRNVRRAC